MKVALHCGQLLQPVPGGIGRYVSSIAKALPESGVQVIPFAAGPAPSEISSSAWIDLGAPQGRLRYALWHQFRRPSLRFDADVIHAPSLAIPPKSHRPLVVTIHDIAFRRAPEMFTTRGRAFHERGLAIVRDEADAIIAPSEFTRDELLDIGFESERIHLVRHGTDPAAERDRDEVNATLSANGISEPYVLAVGTIEPRKGFDVLAAAHRKLRKSNPKLRLIIAGPRGWGVVGDIDGDGVIQLGRVSDDLLDALYRGAQVCCVPSRYEGFGLPALEAMARGCPVVASDVASLREIVGGAGILVPVGDDDSLATSIAALLDSPSQRAEIVAQGASRVRELSWQRSAQGHAQVYRAVTSALS